MVSVDLHCSLYHGVSGDSNKVLSAVSVCVSEWNGEVLAVYCVCCFVVSCVVFSFFM